MYKATVESCCLKLTRGKPVIYKLNNGTINWTQTNAMVTEM